MSVRWAKVGKAKLIADSGVEFELNIRIFQSSPTRITAPVALDLSRFEVLAFNSRTPSSGCPYLITSRTYNVRGILIYRDDIVGELRFLEQLCIPFFDSLPPVDWSSVRHINRVLRKARGGSGSIVLVYRIGMFSNHLDKLLPQLWIWRVCVFAQRWAKRKLIAKILQEPTAKPIFIVSVRVSTILPP